jgi:hypothetical protein
MTSQRFFNDTGRVIAFRPAYPTGHRLVRDVPAGRTDRRFASVDTSGGSDTLSL